jgi:RND family efflux transporter MFP subunit
MNAKTVLISCLFAVVVATAFSAIIHAGRVDGFTEPYKAVDVATTEVGILTDVMVGEGEVVEKGHVVATLDNEVQISLLSIAEKNLELRGRFESAKAEHELRQQRLGKLEALQNAGHARREEVERARADLAIAGAQVLAAEEELAVRKLELDKTEIQVARRQVIAPLDGIVATVYKGAGEFVAPTDPQVLTVVQLDQLLAVFSVPSKDVDQIDLDMILDVAIGGTVVEGKVERIAPLTDAESDTVRVKLWIDNQDGVYRSGQRCSLLIPDPKQQKQSPPK